MKKNLFFLLSMSFVCQAVDQKIGMQPAGGSDTQSPVAFDVKSLLSESDAQKSIVNTTDREIHIVNDERVEQAHEQDPALILSYVLKSTARDQDLYVFPNDFLLEVPYTFMKQHPSKRLDQICVLGSHNNFTNLADGFVYYQQGQSSTQQFLNGVRMFRPAWHNPSGSPIDSPNQEPILCHSDDNKCATVSLATRAFRPHKLVKELNEQVVSLLNANKDQYMIIGVNNYLTVLKTETEIEKVPGLKDLIITPADVANIENQKLWNGHWPTLDWMLKNNKRILILDDDLDTKYSFAYSRFVKRNQYGTVDIVKAGQSRGDLTKLQSYALVETSWFQDISLDQSEQAAIVAAVGFYQGMQNKLYSHISWMVDLGVSALKKLGFPVDFFKESMTLNHINTAIEFTLGKFKAIANMWPFSSVIGSIASMQKSFNQAMQDIKGYLPKNQENSLQELLALCAQCHKTGVLSSEQIPTILMLDFSTTQGDGIVVVNILNILMDQVLKLQFKDLGGFSVNGQEVKIPEEVLPEVA